MSHKKQATITKGIVMAPLDELMPFIKESLAVGKSVEIYPRGISMRPLIREGRDSVILSLPQKRAKKNDILLFSMRENYVLHRVIGEQRDGCYVLCGDNRRHCERGVSEDNVIAVVTGIKRDGRPMKMDSFIYRTYLAFLSAKRRFRWFCIRVYRKLLRVFRKHLNRRK